MQRRYRATCPICMVVPEGMKHCHGECDLIKPLDEFHKDSGSPDGKTGRCKSCNNESSTAYQKRMAEDPEWAEAERTRKAVYWAEVSHKYAYNRNTPEYMAAYYPIWAANHAASVQAYSQVRRARKAGAAINEPVNREYLADMHGWTCMAEVCHHPDSRDIDSTLTYIDSKTGKPNPWYLSVDHIVQINDIGDNSYANTRPTHLRCNLSRPRGPRNKSIDIANDICDNNDHDEGTTCG